MVHAEVRPSSPPAGVNLANYQFLVRAPKGTGFQVDRDECVWPPNSWPATDSGWVSASNATIDIVRCGIGDGTTKLEIWLNLVGNTHPSFVAYDLEVKQAWHRAGNGLSYAIATPLVKNAVPLPSRVSMMKGSIRDASRVWNSASTGFRFTESVSPSNIDSVDVIVQGYSTYTSGYTDICGQLSRSRSPRGVACVRWRDPSQNPHNHPHLGKETLYFEYPPDPGYRTSYLWTRDSSKSGVTVGNVTYLYMPSYMMHEIGHSAGLDHPAAADNVMSSPIEDYIFVPTADDKDAMKSIYANNNHTAH